MSVEFEGENTSTDTMYRSRQILGVLATPTAVQWLINKNIVKTEKSAARILLGIMVICLSLSVAIVLYAVGVIPNLSTLGKKPEPIPYTIWKTLPVDLQQKIPHQPAPEGEIIIQ